MPLESLDESVAEYKTSSNVLLVNVQSLELERFSLFVKLRIVYAYVLRFITNLRSDHCDRKSGPLNPDELKGSEKKLIQLVQKSEYSKELQELRSSNTVNSHSNLKSLSPFLDDEGLLRVGGRLSHAQLHYDERHPVILPANSFLTKLIVRFEHERLLHSGAQAVLFSLRSRYWIPKGRNCVRGVVRKCYKCFKCKPTSTSQLMGQLPLDRVRPQLPFTNVGIDYGGPILMKGDNPRSRVKFKAYIALFVCLVTKAIHLEVVKSLTTQDFYAAFNRFVSRRGLPSIIWSDNGTNFVGAKNDLVKFFKENEAKLSQYSSSLNVSWNFIPPSSPHFGGIWEAGIKSCKSLLKRIAGKHLLNFEELNTLLCQIEAVLNSRPLCTLSDNPDDLSYLTPGHFLIGRNITNIPSSKGIYSTSSLKSRWKIIQNLQSEFWDNWSSDYLRSLQEKTKWCKQGSWIPSIGDLVLLREDNLPPLMWKTGVICQVHPGADQLIRVVSVRTKDKILKRALVKVCPLPKDSD